MFADKCYRCGVMFLASVVMASVGCGPTPPTADSGAATAASTTDAKVSDAKAADAKPQDAKLAPAKPLGPPTIPDGFVFRPTIDTSSGKVSAGTAFAVAIPGQDRPVILTAIHLLGPAGGLPDEVPAIQVPEVVKGLALRDCFRGQIRISEGFDPLVILEAGPFDRPMQAGDILAFLGPAESPLKPSPLAAATPAKGERVWLAASVLEGAPSNQRLHSAVIVEVNSNGNLVYQFDNPQLSLQATSGAPVLNAAGEVVAINCGGETQADTKNLVGLGNPVGRFRPHLEAAVKEGPAPPKP